MTITDGRTEAPERDDIELDGEAAGTADVEPTEPTSAAPRPLWRRVAGWLLTTLACLLVVFALLAPWDFNRFTWWAFARIPVEGVVGAAMVLALPSRTRRAMAAIIGVLLGLLTIVRLLDIGFFAILYRPFDLVLDWVLLEYATDFMSATAGKGGAIAFAIGAVVLAVALVVGLPLAVLRLTGIMVRHRGRSTAGVRGVAVVWVICAVLGVEFTAGLPVASTSAAELAYDHASQIPAGIQDMRAFAAESAVDQFRNTSGEQLLTALRGKDVVITFVESYGRTALEHPELAPGVTAALDDGTRRLDAAGFSSRSGFLTSPTVGGGSWLAQATLLSGLWINNQQRYRNLVTTDRLTLNGAFRRAEWRTVGVMPAITQAWPEGSFFGYDQIYVADDLGYRGPRFSYATMPDQYTMSRFQRSERATADHGPVMAAIPLLTSHAPWAPIPPVIDWNTVGDGSVFNGMAGFDAPPESIFGQDPVTVRQNYAHSLDYSINTLVSYVENFGDDDLVLIFLGDHQPAPFVTGEGASHDVPISIVTRDRAVLERISGWGWNPGIEPAQQAPVWRMSDFRDRFLTAFSPPR